MKTFPDKAVRTQFFLILSVSLYDCSHELSKLEVFVAVSSSSSRMEDSSFRNVLNGVPVVVLSLFAAVPEAVDVRLGHVGLG